MEKEKATGGKSTQERNPDDDEDVDSEGGLSGASNPVSFSIRAREAEGGSKQQEKRSSVLPYDDSSDEEGDGDVSSECCSQGEEH